MCLHVLTHANRHVGLIGTRVEAGSIPLSFISSYQGCCVDNKVYTGVDVLERRLEVICAVRFVYMLIMVSVLQALKETKLILGFGALRHVLSLQRSYDEVNACWS